MFIKFVVSVLFITLTPSILFAQDIGVLGLPALEASPSTDGGTQYSLSLQVLALMTAITVVPSIILGMTSFTRIIIVLSILRQALGTQQTPPNQVLIAIALFLSFFIMGPVFDELYNNAVSPYLDGIISLDRALSDGLGPLKHFMIANTRSDTFNLFVDLSQ